MIRVACRASELSLRQLDELSSLLPDQRFSCVRLDSFGDKHKDLSLWEVQACDFFTREIDQAVLEGRADVALHSAKDLPIPLPRELDIYALTTGGDPRDALVSRDGLELARLPGGARIGTSSLSRRDQLRELRPDIEIVPIRGTIGERLDWIDDGRVDAVVVAKVALDRLGWQNRISDILPITTHPLQGRLAVIGPRFSAATPLFTDTPNPRGALKSTCAPEHLRTVFSPIDSRRSYGNVTIAGAGPGNPDLVTLQVQRAIEQASIIYYDALVHPDILTAARGRLVYVGKRKGKHSYPQHEINHRLAESALQGETVLRLKGGDPMIFGRASEEILYLRTRLIDVQVFPGITAASAAASFSEIPLTERGSAASLTLCTAYPAEHIRIPSEGTAVYYMSSHNLPEIVRRWAARFPTTEDRNAIGFALVHNASLPDQQTWQFSLEELHRLQLPTPAPGQPGTPPDQPARPSQQFPGPLLVIAGPAVRPDCRHNWWEHQPHVWATGTSPAPVSCSAPDFSRAHGTGPSLHTNSRRSSIPLIRITPAEEHPNIPSLLEELRPGDWIVFTSRHGVQAFFSYLQAHNNDTRRLAGLNIAAVGTVTAAELAAYGIQADLIPAEESSAGLVEAFQQRCRAPVRILIPGSNRFLPTLQEGLHDLGHHVQRITVYRNDPHTPANLPRQKDGWIFDEIHFTSPSTVQQFFRLFPHGPPPDAQIRLTAIGSATRRALQEYTDA